MDISEELHKYAAKYENVDFLLTDPSWFMHQVHDEANQEMLAFIASCLSYGSRKQFFPKIQFILDCTGGDVIHWIKDAEYCHDIPDNTQCYYRLYNNHIMNRFFKTLKVMIDEYGTIGDFIMHNATDGYTAIAAITGYFKNKEQTIIPKSTSSACKRMCMFLRWMVRDQSPVDLGLWSTLIDKRTLIMPLDTHVLQEASRLGLLHNKISNMSVARRLSNKMLEYFPEDPLKGDFALFGYGINH